MANGVLEIRAERPVPPRQCDAVPAWFQLAQTPAQVPASLACLFGYGPRRHAAWLALRALTVLQRDLGADIVHFHIRPRVMHEPLACQRLPSGGASFSMALLKRSQNFLSSLRAISVRTQTSPAQQPSTPPRASASGSI